LDWSSSERLRLRLDGRAAAGPAAA
jgi:hypothetical protein